MQDSNDTKKQTVTRGGKRNINNEWKKERLIMSSADND